MKRDPLQALGAHIAEQQAPLLREDASDEALRRRLVEHVLQRGAAGPARRAARHWFALAAAASLLVLALGLGLSRWLAAPGGLAPRDARLQFTVGGARAGVLGELESASADAALPLRFSDGSVLDLTPGAQARVLAVTQDGAEVVLESGRARVDIVPRRTGPPAHWQLRSGPFTVQVKGTSFWLGWDRAAEAFSLELLAGKVAVTGCGLGAGRDVLAGERLEASCNSPLIAPPAPAPVPEPAPARLEPESKPRAPARAAARQPETATSWQELARQGDFAAAYAQAAPGWEKSLHSSNRDDLLLLGQSARLTGHGSDAERAYARVRQRFAGSAAAARAAFSLGLLAFEQDPDAALRWLELCLSEQPSGPLSEAALDRLLEASLRVPQLARRRGIAERYLQQYPAGPHAAEARRIASGSGSGLR